MLSNDWLVKFIAIFTTSLVVTPLLWLGFMRNALGFAEVGIMFFSIVTIISIAFTLYSFLLSRRQKQKGD